MTLPLIPKAVEILETRKASTTGEWVFPGVGKTGHLVEPKSAWKRILKRASEHDSAIRDVRLHDLRRTLGSKMAALGISLPIIGKALGHRSLSATAIYANVNLDSVREGVTKATDAMLLLGDGN